MYSTAACMQYMTDDNLHVSIRCARIVIRAWSGSKQKKEETVTVLRGIIFPPSSGLLSGSPEANGMETTRRAYGSLLPYLPQVPGGKDSDILDLAKSEEMGRGFGQK